METAKLISANPFDLIDAKLNQILSIVQSNNEKQIKPEPIKQENDFLVLPEASTFLKMPESTIHHYRKHHSLPSFKSGRRLLFSKTALLKWLDDFNKQNETPISSMISQKNRYAKK